MQEEGERRLRKSEPEYSFKLTAVQSSHLDVLSESDDEEERMDCVHDIHRHMDGAEADAEEEEEYDYANVTNDTFQHGIDTERRGQSDSDMDGDNDDSDGRETERWTRPQIFNNYNGAIELQHIEANYYKKRPAI
jgi:hypothetical protein